MSFTCPHDWRTTRFHADLSTAMEGIYNGRLEKGVETARLQAEEGLQVVVTTESVTLERVVL